MNARRRAALPHELVFLPLGGTGEIGMNCYCYGSGPADDRHWLMVDLGVKFGEDSDPGIDVILPDVGFLSAEKPRLHAIVLTHAHEDHLGAVAWLWPQLECPVYCTPFAAQILALKLKEAGLDEQVPVKVMPVGSRFTLGPFACEYVSVTHSIPEPTALLIETPEGRVLHSGDWKIDRKPVLGQGMDERRLREIGGKGVDVLVCDSTNVLREGFSPSEAEVAERIMELVKRAGGRVAITTFASHLDRIATAIRAARATGREVVIAGRAMRNTIEAARACGMLNDSGRLLDEEEFGYLPPDKVMLLCTGSQGEPRAAIARIAEDMHPHISLEPGDLVIFSSKTIPGNEKEVGRVLNNLARLDIDTITGEDDLVHSSGHPRQGELAMVYEWLKPRALIPMHGEPRHLRTHRDFAKAQGIRDVLIPRDGHILRLAPGPLENIDEAPFGRLHVDGRLIVPGEDGPARQRRKLSFVGIVFVSIVMNGKSELAAEINLQADGLPIGLEGELLEAAELAFGSTPKPRRKDKNALAETIRTSVRRAADMIWGKKPIVKVTVVQV
ncbi:ribonuclease J [Aestuariivirga sp.]|uniref:ribonuclease J n=1 Tax=Aestuariivirga sp. TaxID=2650926 RepID=UPI00391C2E9C